MNTSYERAAAKLRRITGNMDSTDPTEHELLKKKKDDQVSPELEKRTPEIDVTNLAKVEPEDEPAMELDDEEQEDEPGTENEEEESEIETVPSASTSTQGAINVDDKHLDSLKRIKEASYIADVDFKWLSDATKTFVDENSGECGKCPRLWKQSGWQDLAAGVVQQNSATIAKIFRAGRQDFDPSRHPSWPKDQTAIKKIIFCLLKFWSQKYFSGKEKMKRANDNGNGGQVSDASTGKASKKSVNDSPRSSNSSVSGSSSAKTKTKMNATAAMNDFTTIVEDDPEPDDNETGNEDEELEQAENLQAITTNTNDVGEGTSNGKSKADSTAVMPPSLDHLALAPAPDAAATQAEPPSDLAELKLEGPTNYLLKFHVYLNRILCSTKTIYLTPFDSFSEFMGQARLYTKNPIERAAMAKTDNFWLTVPGYGSLMSFGIDGDNAEKNWRHCIKIAHDYVRPGMTHAGETLVGTFMGDSPECPLTVTMAEVEGPHGSIQL